MKSANAIAKRDRRRAARRFRARKKVTGTPDRPRLSVFRSNRYIYAQLIDDRAGKTLASASSLDADVTKGLASPNGVEAAAAVGEKLAERAKEAGVSVAVFDKGWYRYHGRIKALADAVREAGLQI